ncbi:MAG TPA: hypothetical protein DCQ77_14375, partial [Betaproteobacteria bacterium]|nr:hypothetical protein [Betaproteobacteria bacterium]
MKSAAKLVAEVATQLAVKAPCWVSLLIFLVTLTLVIRQPKGLGIGTAAWLGAGAALLAGTVSLSD